MLSPEQSKLIEDRIGLAKAIGHRAWSNLSGYERDEVISWALKGLVDAAVRWPAYCEEHGFDLYDETAQSWFNTYSTRRINGAIIDTLRQLDLATRRERAIVKDILGKGVDLYSPWEHESPEAISAATGLSVADVSAAVSALLRSPLSLEEASEVLVAPDPRSVEDEATQALLARRVAAAVASLPPLHQRVLILSVHLGWPDADVAAAVPEISRDSVMAPWKIHWVIFLRHQAQQSLIKMLRAELSESG